MTTPEDGHTFRFAVTSRLAYGIKGEPGKYDAGWWSEPWTLEVRAHNLPEALRKAAEMPLTAWGMPVEDEALDDDFPDHGEAEDAKAALGLPTPVTDPERWAKDQAIHAALARDDDYSPQAINRTVEDE